MPRRKADGDVSTGGSSCEVAVRRGVVTGGDAIAGGDGGSRGGASG